MAIFLQGCNFDCLYCHNPETITNGPSNDLKRLTVEDVVTEIKKVQPFLSGITVSGGECTLQKEFLTELGHAVKDLGLTFFIDTNGSTDLEAAPELMAVVDQVMLDVKSFDSEEHQMLTRHSNEIVLKNLHHLASIGKLYEVRTVIVPDVLNNDHNVDQISWLLASLDPEVRYKLIKYRPLGVRSHLIESRVPSDSTMENLKKMAEANGLENVVTV